MALKHKNFLGWQTYRDSRTGNICWRNDHFYIEPFMSSRGFDWQILPCRTQIDFYIDVSPDELRIYLWNRQTRLWDYPNPSKKSLSQLSQKEYILYLALLRKAKELQDNWDAFTIN